MVFRPILESEVWQSHFWDAGDYAAKPEWVEKVYGARREKVNRALVQVVSQFVAGGRWLDVGCGIGALLTEARNAGWHAIGLDLSRRAVAIARNAGLDVICGDFPADAPGGTYDVISLIHVLEYVPNPRFLVEECHKRLRPGGVLAMQLKNFAFWSNAERLFRARSGIWCPQDIVTYSPATIRRLLRTSGFGRVRVMPAVLPNRPVLTASFALLEKVGGPVLSPSMTVIAQADGRVTTN